MTIICQVGRMGSGMTLMATYLAFRNWKAFGAKPVFDYNINENYIASNEDILDEDSIEDE